jgi:hypothetical protein
VVIDKIALWGLLPVMMLVLAALTSQTWPSQTTSLVCSGLAITASLIIVAMMLLN